MLGRSFDIVTIGDITTDAFIRIKDAHVNCKFKHNECELCMRFGDKIPFEYVKVIRAAGNAANASIAATRLGLNSAIISDMGNDENGRECLAELRKEKIDTSLIKIDKNRPTNYHFVLWYENDRTILVNHVPYDYALPRSMTGKFPVKTRWLYLTSLPENSLTYHHEMIAYLKANPDIKLTFQPGTFQLKLGVQELAEIYERSEVVIMNMEEAREIVPNNRISSEPNPKTEVKATMRAIANYGPKIVVITDGPNGAYMFDGDHYYFMPIYPDPRPAFERTGCGDSFAATFVSAMAKGLTPLEALIWAPINPMSVAQFIGGREGLLTLDQLEWWLGRAPDDYKPREL